MHQRPLSRKAAKSTPQSAKRALRLAGVGVVSAAALGITTSGSADAAGATATVTGLHVAGGSLVDPVGRTWVADHNGGFCRVTEATDTAPGTIEHPSRADEPGARTCLGGLLPDAGIGPDAAGAPVFYDPSPEFANSGDELAFIPDGASPSSEVVRAQWNRTTRKFDFKDTITMIGARGRPSALAIGPDEKIYATFQRETTIQSISDLDADTPLVEVVGSPSDANGATSIAAGRDQDGRLTVYIGTKTGPIEMLNPDPVTQPVSRTAPFQLPGTGGGPASIGSMAYDLASDTLYAGTSNGTTEADLGNDTLARIDVRTNAVDADYVGGFSMVGGISVRPNGQVDVVDDRALLDPAEPMGLGRMRRVGLPVAHATGTAVTNDTTPSFTIEGDGQVQCLLRGPGQNSGWQDCPTGDFTVADALADGKYTLSVRSVSGGVTGLAEAFSFSVDIQAPVTPVIKTPVNGATVSANPWFVFDAEDGATFKCSFDGGTFELCQAGRTKAFTGAGTHTLRVMAVDGAGNESAASDEITFTVNPALQPELPAPFAGPRVSHRGSSLTQTGMHIATGGLYDPNGRLWVTDHNAGFCRVTNVTDAAPGRIEHPVLPGDTDPTTCLGGLLPGAGAGADAAGAPVLVDPTPTRPGNGDEMALVPDGASPSSEVFRAKWNPDSGLFEAFDSVTTVNAGKGTRPVALTLGADGSVYAVFQRVGDIQRISSPAGANPIARIVGSTADGRGAGAIAAARIGTANVLYVAERTGIRTLRNPNPLLPVITQATNITVPGAGAVGAMTADLVGRAIYVGTANGATQADAGIDRVHRLDTTTGAFTLNWANGQYSMVGGLAVRPDGAVNVMDDPALLDPAEPLGTGRVFTVGLPAAHVTGGPQFTSSRTPSFTVAGDGQVSCRLTGPGQSGAWAACPANGVYAVSTPLADGTYRLAVRSTQNSITGTVEGHVFTVDTVAPEKPSITSPAAGLIPARPWFEFAGEAGVKFQCSWNGGAFEDCEPGYLRTFAENTQATLRVRAIDKAGNVSSVSDPVSYQVRANVTRVTITEGPAGPTRSTSATFAWTADAPDVEFGCRISGQVFASCGTTKSYSNLADGTYQFDVHARDSAGNVTPVASRTFTVDTRRPVLTLPGLAQGATVRTGQSVTIGVNEAVTLTCALDGGAPVECNSTLVFQGLTAGQHTLVVSAVDAAGNVSVPLTRTFTFDPTAAAPAPTPASPSVTVIDFATGRPLVFSLDQLDRRVDLARIQQTGIRVTVIPPRGAQLVRFRVFRVAATAAAAGKKAKPLATVYRSVKGGKKTTVRLSHKELGRLKAGTYRLEASAGVSKRKLGTTVVTKFTVTR